MKLCHRCKTPWEDAGQPGFNNTCSGCGMSLHACLNCLQFVPRGSVRCLVAAAETVVDPRAGNRCSHFEFTQAGSQAKEIAAVEEQGISDPDTARRRWEELFRN